MAADNKTLQTARKTFHEALREARLRAARERKDRRAKKGGAK